MISLPDESEQGFRDQLVHPAGRTRIPGPSSPAFMQGDRIYIGRRYIRFHLIRAYFLRAIPMVQGIDHTEQFISPCPVSQGGKGHGKPDGRMRILPAILPAARYLSFAIT